MRGAVLPALALALAGGPAAAQVYGDRIIDACLAAHWGGQNDREACIGIAARACMPVGEGGADVAVSCHEAEAAQWSAMLDETLDALRFQLANGRADGTPGPDGAPGQGAAADGPAGALDRAQAAWEAFRDATCDFDAVRWPDTEIGRADRAECIMRLTARQVFELQSRLVQGM